MSAAQRKHCESSEDGSGEIRSCFFFVFVVAVAVGYCDYVQYAFIGHQRIYTLNERRDQRAFQRRRLIPPPTVEDVSPTFCAPFAPWSQSAVRL